MEVEDDVNSSISPDWDQDPPFTDEELRAIDAIEAAYGRRNRQPAAQLPQDEQEQRPKTRRKLPSSLLASPSSPSFSLSPCQAYLRMKLPAIRFEGKILYSRTSAEVERAAMELLQNLEFKKREMGQVAIGLDIEWKPTFKRGVLPGKTAVMQICGDTGRCYVMHIIHSGITPALQTLLEDSALLKVGVGIGNDAVKVFRDYNVSVKDVVDLSYLANQKLGGDSKRWSLASLTEMLVCKELPKPNKIRLGNWEANVLSKDKLQYAATDAFASWHVYQVIKSLPEIVKDENGRR